MGYLHTIRKGPIGGLQRGFVPHPSSRLWNSKPLVVFDPGWGQPLTQRDGPKISGRIGPAPAQSGTYSTFSIRFNMNPLIDKIVIASDHAGYDLKESVITYLLQEGYEVEDFGPKNSDSVDYPDYGVSVAKAILEAKANRGILICGTGIGMSIVVNRFPGIRGTLCSDLYTAKLCREHNDSNILIMGGRVVGKGLAHEIVKTWLTTSFEGGRHTKRIEKIEQIDEIIKRMTETVKIRGDV